LDTPLTEAVTTICPAVLVAVKLALATPCASVTAD
jgi:hypothetical protein